MRIVFMVIADCIDLVAEAVAALGIAVGDASSERRDETAVARGVEPGRSR